MTQGDREVVRDFFENMYGDTVSSDHRLVLWSSRDKKSVWNGSIDETVDRVMEGNVSNLYFGVCLQDWEAAARERGSRVRREGEVDMTFCRGYPSTSVVMPGIWLDLDIAGPGHEKMGLPQTIVDAERILSSLPFDPTWVVDTGGGWHVYWLWREPWVLETDEERDRAAALVRGFQKLAIQTAIDMGFVLDSTHDLSRVLRPVGTVNAKYNSVVRFRDHSDHRFNPSDFDEWIDEVQPIVETRPSTEIGNLQSDLQPPPQKFMSMLNLAPQFAATWRRERKDFPSQSEYDMSLASMAARAAWSDEEIVGLVVAHRREGGESLKIDRPGYYERLISKARASIESDHAHERLSDRVEAVSTGDADIEEERSDFLTDVSVLLGFRIQRIIKFVTDPPQYRLVLDEGQIHLGGVDSILNPAKFRSSIAAVAGHLIQRFSGARWDPVAQAILQSVEELDLGIDSSTEGLVGEWLTEYLTQHRPSEDRAEAIPIRHPFLRGNGEVCLFLSEFRSWLGFHRDEKMGRKQLATLLRTAGSEPVTINYVRESDGKKTTASCWTVPVRIASTLPSPSTREDSPSSQASPS